LGHRTVSLLATLLAAPAFAQIDVGAKAVDPATAEQRGFDYWIGRGVERDNAEAAKWLEQATAAGRPYAAALLADLYRRGDGVAQNAERARELDHQAAALGVATAQTALGYEMGILPGAARDPAAAIPWLNAAAEQEHPVALFVLGQLYLYGDGVERDEELGWRFITRAAELGHVPGRSEAGGKYLFDGADSPDDVRRGLYFLNDAASSGYGPAAYGLGKMHLTGWRVEQDLGLAVQWLTRANELKVPFASLWLAELYAKGLGVEADESRAAELRAQLPTLPISQRNGFAWELSVSPSAEARNGAFAVDIMVVVTTEQPTPAYLDTLAAAYAEAGRFEDAVRAQQTAIDALPSDMPTTAPTRVAFDERMQLYRSGQPYREPWR